jgi:hypothetical protein
MSDFKKISCKNCGGELIFSPGTQLSTCNFCGSEFDIENSSDTKIKSVDKILPFSTTDDEFEIAALIWLSEGELTPDDILEGSLFNNQVGVYLPMWLFDGRYDGSWSASSGYDRIEEYIGKSFDGKKLETKTRTVTDWRPSNGSCKGDFQFLATASSESSIPANVKAFSHNVEVTHNNLKDFKTEYTQGFSMIELELDPDNCWNLFGKIQAEYFVERLTKKRIPGDKYKDFYVDAVYDLNKKTSCYVPFWLRNYKYKDDGFHLYMDGTNTLRLDGERPVDYERRNVLKEIDKSRNIGCGIFVGIAIVILQLSDPDIYGPLFWVIAVIAGIFYYNQEQKKKTIIKESLVIRKEKLNAKINSIKSGTAQNKTNDKTPSF